MHFLKKIKNKISWKKLSWTNYNFYKNLWLNYQCLFILKISSDKNSVWDLLWDLLVKYYQIWPPFQWATSLVSLVLIYWISGYFYNKFLSKKGGWMDTKTRVWMIILDLFLNFSLGIYYMNFRETFMGQLMLKCPVFFSPFFWLIELIFFYVYYRYINFSKNQKEE